jgi:putative ABC transport system permease protein
MIDIDKWQEIFHTLKQNKLRTALTAFGVFWGIFILVIMLGAGTGLQNAVFSNLGGFARNSMFIWAQQTTMPIRVCPGGVPIILNTKTWRPLNKIFLKLK